MKYALIFSFILHASVCMGQHERNLKVYFEENSFFEHQGMKKYEAKLSKEMREKLFQKFVHFGESDEDRDYGFWGDTSGVHFVNLNNDDYIDVIYENSLGMYDASFYYGTKDSFMVALSDVPMPNFIKNLVFKDKICIEIVFESTPYVDYGHSEMVYKLINNKFTMHSYRRNQDCTFRPSKYYKKPMNTQTKIDSCPLRENPEIGKAQCGFKENSQNPEEYNEFNNNIVGRYKKGSKGLVWGEFYDKSNVKWVLVELSLMDEIVPKKDYTSDYLDKEYYIGWMQAEDLEIIR